MGYSHLVEPSSFFSAFGRSRFSRRETRAELRKVTWPTRREALRLTGIVLAATIGFALFLGVFAMGLWPGRRAIWASRAADPAVQRPRSIFERHEALGFTLAKVELAVFEVQARRWLNRPGGGESRDRRLLMESMEEEAKHEAAKRIKKIEEEAKEQPIRRRKRS
jgi:preprotein translocase SecE subunit